MKLNFDKRRVVGRRIAAVNLRSFMARPDTDRSARAHDVEFVLDNGARIRFMAEETECGEYGIRPIYVKPEVR